jgi:hypothetical protein
LHASPPGFFDSFSALNDTSLSKLLVNCVLCPLTILGGARQNPKLVQYT